MLVVADELTRRVGGEGRLARAGEAKEHGSLTRLRVHVGGAVHRKHVVLDRQQVVHEGEDALLDLAGVAGAGNHDAAAREVEHDRRVGVDVVVLGVGVVAGSSEDADVGLAKVRELLGRGADEHLADEQRLAGALAHDADLAGVVAVGAGKAVDDVEVAAVKVAGDAMGDALVDLTFDGDVRLAPADVVVNGRVIHDEAVVGRATRTLARVRAAGHTLTCEELLRKRVAHDGPPVVVLTISDKKVIPQAHHPEAALP